MKLHGLKTKTKTQTQTHSPAALFSLTRFSPQRVRPYKVTLATYTGYKRVNPLNGM